MRNGAWRRHHRADATSADKEHENDEVSRYSAGAGPWGGSNFKKSWLLAYVRFEVWIEKINI